MAALSIFKLPQVSLPIYVTDRFVQRVREHDLTGFFFAKVWPLPPGTNWEMRAKAELYQSWGRPMPTLPVAPASAATSSFRTRPLNGAEQKEVDDGLAAAARELSVDPQGQPVERVQARIQTAVGEVQRWKQRDQGPLLDRAFLLGVAWGETLVRDLGWQLKILVAATGQEALAVVSPNESLAVPVLLFFKRLVTDPKAESTSHLTFNMIKSGNFRSAPGTLKIVS